MAIHNLVKLQKVLQEFEGAREQARCSNMVTADLIAIALEVAKGQGVTGRDIELMLDVNKSKVSRLLAILSEEQPNGARGMGLIVDKADPTNHKNIVRYPSDKLKAIAKRIDKYMAE